jgi:hypothetical protein
MSNRVERSDISENILPCLLAQRVNQALLGVLFDPEDGNDVSFQTSGFLKMI